MLPECTVTSHSLCISTKELLSHAGTCINSPEHKSTKNMGNQSYNCHLVLSDVPECKSSHEQREVQGNLEICLK